MDYVVLRLPDPSIIYMYYTPMQLKLVYSLVLFHIPENKYKYYCKSILPERGFASGIFFSLSVSSLGT
jgi:hypothetical protein